MTNIIDEDRDQLHALGYAPELHRGMSSFSNFAISFSIISILAGGMTSFWLGMVTSGPRIIVIGWVVVGFFALMVGMAMGEICSAYPTAGGLYGINGAFDAAPAGMTGRRRVHHRLPVLPRPAARPVHDHRLRRLGARQRGDVRGPHRGPRRTPISSLVRGTARAGTESLAACR